MSRKGERYSTKTYLLEGAQTTGNIFGCVSLLKKSMVVIKEPYLEVIYSLIIYRQW